MVACTRSTSKSLPFPLLLSITYKITSNNRKIITSCVCMAYGTLFLSASLMPELMFLSVLKMIKTNKKKISVYLVLLEGETLEFHGSHLSHEGRKSVHTTPSQANKLKDATRVRLVEKAGAQAIATDLNTSVDFFSPFDVVGHGSTVNILHRIFLINLRAADSVAQATMDGSADILTLSVGQDELPEDDIPFSRVCDVFMLFARGVGVLVAQAAGNHTGQPFQLLCIAARSTDRSCLSSVLGNGQKLGGAGLPGMADWWSMVGIHQYTFCTYVKT
ncbi:hypothetical protein POTOM_016551 [Populus tomentosa]|uniref:Peptidase S8/S53 domain-containing protein n=1 Tax=Populus tomentosa TaxID=118781 RepID=A0A8X8A2R0_POPTO|nr:hypothetical protein POTOM_016551 [Populus tomentosa]